MSKFEIGDEVTPIGVDDSRGKIKAIQGPSVQVEWSYVNVNSPLISYVAPKYIGVIAPMHDRISWAHESDLRRIEYYTVSYTETRFI